MKTVTIEEVEHIAFKLAQMKLSYDEPIPDFSTRFPNILESCLITPSQQDSGKDLYPSLVSKAGILFYQMIKSKPFENGNRKIAATVLLVFLYKNGKWLKADTKEFFDFLEWVAQSPAMLKEQVLSGIELFIRSHLVSV
jgi:prophage maintenance system killer protein